MSISFNILDPDQKRLFEHAKTFVNFSAAAKRWLENSMSGVKVIKSSVVETREEQQVESPIQKVLSAPVKAEKEFDPIAALF